MIPLHDDNPTVLTPVVTIAFIATCVLVFFYQASLPVGSGDTFVFQYGAIPALVFGEADPPEMGVAIPAYATLITAWRDGDTTTARPLGHHLARLSSRLFAEPNPTVIKAVLHAEGRIPTAFVRLPLLPAAATSAKSALHSLTQLFPYARK